MRTPGTCAEFWPKMKAEQREYLNTALEIDPEHQPARKRMEQMQPDG